MDAIVFIIVIALVAWLNHYLAEQRGRNAVGWAVAGVIFGLLSTILLLILGKTEARQVELYKKANNGQ